MAALELSGSSSVIRAHKFEMEQAKQRMRCLAFAAHRVASLASPVVYRPLPPAPRAPRRRKPTTHAFALFPAGAIGCKACWRQASTPSSLKSLASRLCDPQ
eukprot:3837867-Pyramimonas_sp.AAC.1